MRAIEEKKKKCVCRCSGARPFLQRRCRESNEGKKNTRARVVVSIRHDRCRRVVYIFSPAKGLLEGNLCINRVGRARLSEENRLSAGHRLALVSCCVWRIAREARFDIRVTCERIHRTPSMIQGFSMILIALFLFFNISNGETRCPGFSPLFQCCASRERFRPVSSPLRTRVKKIGFFSERYLKQY